MTPSGGRAARATTDAGSAADAAGGLRESAAGIGLEEAAVDGDDAARPRTPQLRLDELLEEVRARIDAARGTTDRVHSLLEAVLSVGRELNLTQALRRIVEAAAVLVGARYAALGVIGPDGESLAEFLTVGIPQEEIAAIGPYPKDNGLLGELISHPEPLRLEDLSQHEASYGPPATIR